MKKSLNLGTRLAEEARSIHRSGECRCVGRNRRAARVYLKYPTCHRCGKLFSYLVIRSIRQVERRYTVRDQAVVYLWARLGRKGREDIRRSFEELGERTWVREHHHGFGRKVRNALRAVGLDERKLGVQDLDDIYVDLLKEAVK